MRIVPIVLDKYSDSFSPILTYQIEENHVDVDTFGTV